MLTLVSENQYTSMFAVNVVYLNFFVDMSFTIFIFFEYLPLINSPSLATKNIQTSKTSAIDNNKQIYLYRKYFMLIFYSIEILWAV